MEPLVKTLKDFILLVLDTSISVIGNPVLKSVLVLARSLVARFLPDDIVLPQIPLGAAPDVIKNYVADLFDKAIALVNRPLFAYAMRTAKRIVIEVLLDEVWDSVFTPNKVSTKVIDVTHEVEDSLLSDV